MITGGNGSGFVTAPISITASSAGVVPAGAVLAHFILKGGGGGGSGGGSATTVGGVNDQIGGAGGGAGERLEMVVAVTPGQAWTYTQGAGGAAGAGAPANGNGSAQAGSGVESTLVIGATTYEAAGGGGAGGAVGNSPNACWGGLYAGAGAPRAFDGNGLFVGHGASSNQDNTQVLATPLADVCGGGAGSNATATNGGLGGSVYTNAGPINPPANGGSGTTAGTNAPANATLPGCGGAGGGGGAPGGAGGNGSAGAAGSLFLVFLA